MAALFATASLSAHCCSAVFPVAHEFPRRASCVRWCDVSRRQNLVEKRIQSRRASRWSEIRARRDSRRGSAPCGCPARAQPKASVPSPPSTISRSTCAASCFARQTAAARQRSTHSCVSSSTRLSILRPRSQSSSGGTTADSSSRFGLEMMPAVRIIGLDAAFYSTRGGGRAEKTPGFLRCPSAGSGARL